MPIMTEADLTGAVIALAEELGLLVHWCRDSRKCKGRKGLPDLIIVGRKLLFAELKSGTGGTSGDQDLWLWHLDRAGQMWVLWRPADYENGTIRETLEALR